MKWMPPSLVVVRKREVMDPPSLWRTQSGEEGGGNNRVNQHKENTTITL